VLVAGRRVVLIESITWPPGRYVLGEGCRIICDDMRTGQSVRPLVASIDRWRTTLPPDHTVAALIVVHPIGMGTLNLPDSPQPDLVWSLAGSAISSLYTLLPSGTWTASDAVLAVFRNASAADADAPPQ
jgi:hypothetical protein